MKKLNLTERERSTVRVTYCDKGFVVTCGNQGRILGVYGSKEDLIRALQEAGISGALFYNEAIDHYSAA